MGNSNPPKETKSRLWLEVVKVIGPLLIGSGIIGGILEFHYERDDEAAARYLNIIRDLGNDSNSVRAGAVITMGAYLRSDKNFKKYKEQGIYVLVNHLADEKEPLVIATIQDILVNISVGDTDDTVVRRLANTNRYLWRSEKKKIEDEHVLLQSDSVSGNLQSIADTMIKIFQQKKYLSSNLDLSKVYLTRAQLSDDYSVKGVEFINVILEDAFLVQMNLKGVVMRGKCKLNRASLDAAILTQEAKLAGAELKEAHLEEADLEGADLEGANFDNAILTRAILKGANLKDANLKDAHLKGANLEGANLTGANLAHAKLLDANLVGADLPDANLVGADLPGANLEDANLTDANLVGANLTYSNMVNATLQGADLFETDLTEANLVGANLTEANMLNSTLQGADLFKADLTDANLAGADLKGANLESANLDGANLEGADLRAALLFGIDPNKFQSDLDKHTISKELYKEFEDNRIYLSQNIAISMEEKDHRWLITDKDNEQTYTVRKEEHLNICTEPNIVETELFGIDSKKFQSDFDKGTISEDLRQEFENKDISLSQNATVSIGEKDRTWLINEKDYGQTFTVRKEDGQLKIYEKTKLDPTELFSIDSKKFKKDLDDVTISEDLRQEFKNNWLDLSDNTAISVKEKGRIWLITDKDDEQTYIVRKEDRLNICKETKFKFEDIKKAENWQKAIFDDDTLQKLSSPQD